jgi:hypothetical protein
METFSLETRCGWYTCGLAFSAIAGMLYSGRSRPDLQRGWGWLLGLAAGEAVGCWTELSATYASDPSFTWILHIVLRAVGCVALVELVQASATGRPAGLLNRWGYVPMIGVAVLGCWLGRPAWCDVAYRALFAWQGGMLAARFLWNVYCRPATSPGKPQVVAIIALLGYGLAATFQLAVLATLPALLAASSLWVAYQQAGWIAGGSRLARRWVASGAFLLLFSAGCWGLQYQASLPEPFPDAVPLSYTDVPPVAGNEEGVEEDSQDNSAISPELRRCGLAVLPIATFVLILVGLSRLPFVR